MVLLYPCTHDRALYAYGGCLREPILPWFPGLAVEEHARTQYAKSFTRARAQIWHKEDVFTLHDLYLFKIFFFFNNSW